MISSWVRSFVLGLPLFSSERPMDLFAFLTQFPVEFSIDDFPSTSTGNPCDSKISYLVCPLECRSMNSSMNSLVKDTYLGVTDLTQGLDRSIETCSSVKRMPAIKKTSDESVIGGNLFGRVFFLDCPNYGVQFNWRWWFFFRLSLRRYGLWLYSQSASCGHGLHHGSPHR